jgi:cobalamin biosynthesis Co2+ chelatase CbiK
VRWHGEAPPAPYDPRLFWSVAVAVVAAYPLTWPLLTHLYQPHVQGVRLLCFLGLGLVAGAAAVRLRRTTARGRMES